VVISSLLPPARRRLPPSLTCLAYPWHLLLAAVAKGRPRSLEAGGCPNLPVCSEPCFLRLRIRRRGSDFSGGVHAMSHLKPYGTSPPSGWLG
jgi:hypothetical protein